MSQHPTGMPRSTGPGMLHTKATGARKRSVIAGTQDITRSRNTPSITDGSRTRIAGGSRTRDGTTGITTIIITIIIRIIRRKGETKGGQETFHQNV